MFMLMQYTYIALQWVAHNHALHANCKHNEYIDNSALIFTVAIGQLYEII